jgi:hypothetical protein
MSDPIHPRLFSRSASHHTPSSTPTPAPTPRSLALLLSNFSFPLHQLFDVLFPETRVDVDDVPGVDDAGHAAEKPEDDVDDYVGLAAAAAFANADGEGWDYEGEDGEEEAGLGVRLLVES